MFYKLLLKQIANTGLVIFYFIILNIFSSKRCKSICWSALHFPAQLLGKFGGEISRSLRKHPRSQFLTGHPSYCQSGPGLIALTSENFGDFYTCHFYLGTHPGCFCYTCCRICHVRDPFCKTSETSQERTVENRVSLCLKFDALTSSFGLTYNICVGS